jgi:voltage-gated sodium channel
MIADLKKKVRAFVDSAFFKYFIILVIFVNSILIGVETGFKSPVITLIQTIAVWIFLVELILRWLGKTSFKEWVSDGWNIFDFFIVAISMIPDEILGGSSVITLLRILRVFRILRVVKAFRELRLMLAVLMQSFKALGFNALLFTIMIYLYAVVGVTLFKLPQANDVPKEMQDKLELLATRAPNAPGVSPDPYMNIGEASFTLFRLLTGEDWTDLRYNLIEASKLKIVNVDELTITIYHVSWYVIAAYLLLNLLVGAIIGNYQAAMEKERREEEDDREKLLHEQIDRIEKKLDQATNAKTNS